MHLCEDVNFMIEKMKVWLSLFQTVNTNNINFIIINTLKLEGGETVTFEW